MFPRAVLAFLALPGVVGILVPLAWLWRSSHTALLHPLGLIPLGIGFLALLWCVRDFYVSGKGTLAPWAPPKHLVTSGLYRYSRNPMYIAVIFVLLGWSSAFGSRGLLVYTVLVAFAFHFRVIHAEEPWLARTFGSAWVHYKNDVRRWL